MTKKTSVGHLPVQEKWEFDKTVTECFDDMLERSIPQYALMRSLVNDLVKSFYYPRIRILDLGSSKGGSIESLVNDLDAQFILSEVSKPMIEVLENKFPNKEKVKIITDDIREKFPYCNANITLSILTIQFIPIEYRQDIIQRIYDNLSFGGVFIFVEKVLGSNALINKTLNDNYYNMKSINGYSEEDIQRKKLALEGVLVPVTAKWNENLLEQAGFRNVDVFYRCLCFSGWIAIK